MTTISHEIERPKKSTTPTSPLIEEGQEEKRQTSKLRRSKGLPFTGSIQIIVANMKGGKIYSYDPYSGNAIHTFEGHSKAIWRIDTTNGDNRIYSVSSDKTCRAWDSRTGECKYVFPELITKTPFSWMTTLAVTKNHVAMGTDKGQFVIYQKIMNRYDLLRPAIQIDSESGGIFAIDMLPGSQVLLGTEKGQIMQYDATSGKHVLTSQAHPKQGQLTSFSRAGSNLFTTAQYDEKIRVWDVRDPTKAVATLSSHIAPVWHTIEHHGFLFSAGADGAVKKWHISQMDKPMYTLPKWHEGECVYRLGVIDDKLMASCGGDGTIKIFKTANGELVRTIKGELSSKGVHDMAILNTE